MFLQDRRGPTRGRRKINYYTFFKKPGPRRANNRAQVFAVLYISTTRIEGQVSWLVRLAGGRWQPLSALLCSAYISKANAIVCTASYSIDHRTDSERLSDEKFMASLFFLAARRGLHTRAHIHTHIHTHTCTEMFLIPRRDALVGVENFVFVRGRAVWVVVELNNAISRS